MKDRLLNQAKKEYSAGQRAVALGLEAVFFVFLLPAGLYFLSGWLDGLLGLPRGANWLQVIIGILILTPAWFFALWAIYAQFTRGRGTPVPLMATQKLIITPPYSYCRNPMAGGAIMAYVGVAIVIGSWSALALVLLGGAALLTYIVKVEEPEMLARFGRDYEIYRRNTPFIIPRINR